MATIKKACKGVSYPKSSSVSKRIGSPSKAKNGKSFPDLNKDGKITKADVLKGRGVIAKKGMKVKKAQTGMTMRDLVKKYPGTDTTARGDVRGSEINSRAPKKVLDKYNDIYNAFDRKSKTAPKAKPTKMRLKKGGMVRKAQDGIRKAPEVKMTSTKNYDTKITNYPGGGSDTTTTFNPRGGARFKIPSVSKKPKAKTGAKMTKKCAYGCK